MLIDPATLSLYLVACLVMIASPGPDMAFITATATAKGPRPAIAAVLGIASGGAVWSIAIAVGVAQLVAENSIAFDAIRWIGAAYLVWLAWRTMCARSGLPANDQAGEELGAGGYMRSYATGLAVNLGNPKAALFYAAFVPQFADPAQGMLEVQLLALGFILAGLSVPVYVGLAVMVGTAGQRVRQNRTFAMIQKWLLTTVFGGLAVRLALMER